MMSWQRRLRFGLGLFVLLFAAGLFFSLRHTRAPKPVPVSAPKADPQAVVQSAKGTFIISKGDQLDIRADYDLLLTYSNGTNRLVGMTAHVPRRSGRDFTLRAHEAVVKNDNADIALNGAVQVDASDGLQLNTETATYRKDRNFVDSPGPVTFKKGRMNGSGQGMTYDQDADVLTILDKAVVKLAPDEKGEGAVDISSGKATLARKDKFIQFENGVKILRGGETTTADLAIAHLTDDEKSVKLLELRGTARVVGSGGAPGSLQGMNSRDMDLYYAEGQKLQQAVLTGAGAIDLAGEKGTANRRLAADWIDLRLGPDGTTLVGLGARDNVQLDLPADKTTPARAVRAVALDATGEPGKGLTEAVFTGRHSGVEFREMPKPPANARVARAAKMVLALQGGFSSIQSARFGGGVTFVEGNLAAGARDAAYLLDQGLLKLSGNDAATRQPPRVVDEQTTIEGKTIDIGLNGRKIVALEGVKSDLRPKKKPANGKTAAPGTRAAANGAPAGDEKTTRLPAILKSEEPVSATADRLDYDGGASHAVYTGKARLWQGDTTIKGDRITLDDQKGDLAASGNVVTNMMLLQVNDKTKAKDQVHSVASAKDMVYKDDVRCATYTGTAHMNGPQGDLTADKIELFLRESGNEVDRLEAYNTVNVKTPEGRKATGARLTYFSADERYLMHGAPVKIIEECRETIGKTLTFFRSADRIIIDGNEQKRTETKGVSACSPGPRSSD